MMIILLHLSTNTNADGTKKGVKIAVPLKYLSSFWRSLEMPLINCVLNVIESCVSTSAELGANADVTGADGATFKISGAKLYVPVVTLSAEDNVKLVKQLNKGFKRPAYWNKYKVIDNKVADIAAANAKKHIRELIDSSYQGVKRLFVFAYDNTAGYDQVSDDSFKKHFFQELKLKITTSKLMEEIFMISKLMTRLSNTTKSEKYQQHKVIITRLVVCWILLILKRITG